MLELGASLLFFFLFSCQKFKTRVVSTGTSMMRMQCPRATATSSNGLMALGTLAVMLAQQVPPYCIVQSSTSTVPCTRLHYMSTGYPLHFRRATPSCSTQHSVHEAFRALLRCTYCLYCLYCLYNGLINGYDLQC